MLHYKILGVATLARRKNILKLAQRMTWSFCHAIGVSSFHSWTKVTSKTGEDIRLSSKKNLNDPGEHLGLILCFVCSVWLPVSPNVLFGFLKDETRCRVGYHVKWWDSVVHYKCSQWIRPRQ
ncbi:Homeobox-leucine zipper protein GLABRA 2 [Spatholobus suberectus]|nr:Homeobox-leucine zipper protein GLABRA 2 [Spatholobus suberectus]